MIPLPNVPGKILSKVIEYCKFHVEAGKQVRVRGLLSVLGRRVVAGSAASGWQAGALSWRVVCWATLWFVM
jgi:hypothetical protein